MSLNIRLALLALAFPALAQANDLLRVYQLALRNDPTIVAAKYARDAAVQVEPKALALLLPQVGASFNEVYNDTQIDVSCSDPALGGNLALNRKDTSADSNLSVSLTQPLFNLESWFKLKQASEQAALAQLNYRSSEQALLLRVARIYFGVLGAHDRLLSAEAEKSALQRKLDLTNQNVAVGLSSITDAQDVQARYDLSVANELAAEQELAAARLDLDQITLESRGIDGSVAAPAQQDRSDSLQLAALRNDIPLPLPQPQPASVDSWVAYAGDDNLDLLASRLNFDIAARGVEAARVRHLPTLSASANYVNSRTGGGTFPTTVNGPSAGLTVTVPLFSGGATQAEVRQSVATREQRQAEFEGERRQVERDTRNAYQGVVTGAARVLALKNAMASSRSALQASETGLSIGTRSAVDVLNAQQQGYAAERDYLQSRYDYLQSVLQLKAAAGRLSVQDFAEIDALLAAPGSVRVEALAPAPEGVPVVAAAVPAAQADVPPAPAPTTPSAVPAAAAPSAHGGHAWYVQIGSFADPRNAQAVLGRLQGIGSPGESAPIKLTTGAKVYRVRLGPFPDAAAAKQVLDKLAGEGYSQALVLPEAAAK